MMIPLPAKIIRGSGSLRLSPPMSERWVHEGLKGIATWSPVHDPELGAEGYELVVNPEAVRVNAQTPAGFFYAEQTLRQLAKDSGEIPCVTIRDWPRFKWRGMHLDVARHFFPVEFIKRYLDILALHKLNVFHWHLTDDQGWRIEIQRYPKLTSVGAWRVNREHQPWNEREPQRPGDIPDYGGFYTQEEIAEVVTYARERFIEIVPEIEMPAHALAALAAYPEFSCTGGPFTVAPGQYWPDTDLFCAGNELTFEFLENVLAEVAALFPGRFIHVGGDEADTREWARCPKCQQRMADIGIKDPSALQSYFTRRIEAILKKLNKRLVGWDEILEGETGAERLVMAWRGIERAAVAARRRCDVVLTPSSHLYFDHYQNDPATEPKAFGGFSPLSKVYSFEPVPDDLSAEEIRRVLGVQANLWTEYVSTPEHAEYMVLPRMAALAEAAWSPRNSRDWPGFQERLPELFKLYDERGLNYCKRFQ